ncbi:hypothetical protein ABPG75_002864 [Micractinium tetrahymenae]
MPPRRKTRPPRRQAASDSDSSSGSDVGAGRQLSPELYASLQLAAALRRFDDFATAVRELAALLRALYGSGRCAKQVQAAMAEDAALAIEACDGRLQSRAALAALMEAAERHLPQAKRNALLRKYRQSGVQLARRERRQGPAGWAAADEGEEEEVAAPATFAALPPDVIEQVFRRLDPLTLAKAACVNQEWRAAASDGPLWQAHCAALRAKAGSIGDSKGRSSGVDKSSAGADTVTSLQPQDGRGPCSKGGSQGSSWQQRFAALAAQHPERLQLWRTNRVLAGGRLAWLAPGQPLPPRARHVSTAAVVAYCRSGGRHAGGSGGSSRSDSGSSDSDGGDERLTGRLRFWQL